MSRKKEMRNMQNAKEKNRIGIILLFLIMVAVILSGLFLKLTGMVVLEQGTQVYRYVEKNKAMNTTIVELSINSIENVIAIQEFFSNESCYVDDYEINGAIDIFEFNEDENIWIIANRSDSLVVDMTYYIPYECDVMNGNYYILGENDTLIEYETRNETQKEADGVVNETGHPGAETQPTSSGGSGGGGGGDKTTGTNKVLVRNPIMQANTQEEFYKLKGKAADSVKRISQQETPKSVNKISIKLLLILIGIVIAVIVIFIVFYSFKKQQNTAPIPINSLLRIDRTSEFRNNL